MMKITWRLSLPILGVAVALVLAGCSAAQKPAGGSDWGSATSAAEGGGMDALVAAAKAEGELNLMALPRDWAHYGQQMDAFTAKYGIKINSFDPEAGSADVIGAIKSFKGQSRQIDAIEVGADYAQSAAQQGLISPYKVSTWDDIPANLKDPEGKWWNSYGGYVSIGCDATRVAKCPTTFAELDNPSYANKVALSDNPMTGTAAFSSVWAAALANGGSLDDIKPGTEFFGKLRRAGIYVPVAAKAATIESGETPIVINWDYLNAAQTQNVNAKGGRWSVAVPSDGLYASYYIQAVNKDARHPAAARLWEEFLFSVEGQNEWIKGGARPVELPAMIKAGTADSVSVAALPRVERTPDLPSDQQRQTARQTLTTTWPNQVK